MSGRPRVLVIYASRSGATAEVAKAIAVRLETRGWIADAQAVESIGSLDGYDAIVLGSSIRFGSWLPAMVSFVENRREVLRRVPLAIFSVHVQALGNSPGDCAKRAAYTKSVRAALSPRAEAFFAGVIDPARLSWFDRLAVRLVDAPRGDHRSWDAVQRWADGLTQSLRNSA